MLQSDIADLAELVADARRQIAEVDRIEAIRGAGWVCYDPTTRAFKAAEWYKQDAAKRVIDASMGRDWSPEVRKVKRFGRFCRLPIGLTDEASKIDYDQPLSFEALVFKFADHDPAGFYRSLDENLRRRLALTITNALGFKWSADVDPPERYARWIALPRRLRAEVIKLDFPRPMRTGPFARRKAYDRTVGRF